MFRDILCIISLFSFASSNYDNAPSFEENCQNQATSSNLQKDCFCYGEQENDLDFRICNDVQVDCVWGSWTSYEQCNPETGTQTRTRTKTIVEDNGGKCSGASTESKTCSVDCVWGSWTSYGECNSNTKSRTRTKTVVEKNGGQCSGSSTESKTCNDCYTISGPQTGKPCVFPFKYNGITYTTCTKAWTSTKLWPTLWCSTSVTNGNYNGKWGNCQCGGTPSTPTGCYTTSGKPCFFPFKYKGITYSACTYADWSRPWCSTSVTNGNYNGQWGNCNC